MLKAFFESLYIIQNNYNTSNEGIKAESEFSTSSLEIDSPMTQKTVSSPATVPMITSLACWSISKAMLLAYPGRVCSTTMLPENITVALAPGVKNADLPSDTCTSVGRW